MRCRMIDMRSKEVINVKTGVRIGCVSDVEIDTKEAKLLSIVVYGRLRWCGLLGREDDIIIKWDDIEIIGEDIILVKHHIGQKRKKCKFPHFNKIFKI